MPPIQAYLLILLPIFAPMIASSVAAVIAQHQWPGWFNDGLVWLLILAFAVLDVWVNGAFAGATWLTIAGDIVDAIVFLSSGWLVKLDPWLAWLGWLQANVFNVVPLLEGVQTSKLPPASVNPVRAPTPLPLPTDMPPKG